ncbi:MAG: hypothetical protein ACUVWA_12180 [Candidatus Oleimicrobiaceae bacterium]
MSGGGETVLVFGGAGLVGFQVCRRIARDLKPARLVVASLYQREVREAIKELQKEFPAVSFDGCWGNVFTRAEFSHRDRTEILESHTWRRSVFDDVFGDKETAFSTSKLVEIILQYKPAIIVDTINTATGISYQDVHTTSLEIAHMLRARWDEAMRRGESELHLSKADVRLIETLLVSQSIPQLIRHVQLIWDAMVQVGTRVLVKVGTTGTGGMGLNIPYTHSEDKPSARLMSKTAVAFAHTGLLFLLARTPGGPIVKELKPAAMIGYRKVDYRTIRRHNEPVKLFASKMEELGEQMDLRPRKDFAEAGELMMVGVDTGENGFFTLGEFEAITSMYQMEFVTPEEIAQNVVLEIKGSNTGKDVIAAIDGAVMDPSYRAGYLRQPVINEMQVLEKRTNSFSVALGQLGPPELSKLLYEAHLLKVKYKTLEAVVAQDPARISRDLSNYLRRHPIRNVITSIGLPILLPDGKHILRGPRINIPEYRGEWSVPVTAEAVDRWAAKGWLDLRPQNWALWQERFREMIRSAAGFVSEGSAAFGLSTYLWKEIRIGEVVGWIFNNDPKIGGYRIKAI